MASPCDETNTAITMVWKEGQPAWCEKAAGPLEMYDLIFV